MGGGGDDGSAADTTQGALEGASTAVSDAVESATGARKDMVDQMKERAGMNGDGSPAAMDQALRKKPEVDSSKIDNVVENLKNGDAGSAVDEAVKGANDLADKASDMVGQATDGVQKAAEDA